MELKKEDSTFNHINETAIQLFLEKGYESTRLKDICDIVGIKPASIYFYYDSKKALFFNVLHLVGERINLKLKKVIEESSELETKEQLFLIMKHIINDCLENTKYYKFRLRYKVFPTEELIDGIEAEYINSYEKEYLMLKSSFENLIAENEKAEDINPYELYYEYRSIISGMMYGIILSGFNISEETIAKHCKFFISTVMKKK